MHAFHCLSDTVHGVHLAQIHQLIRAIFFKRLPTSPPSSLMTPQLPLTPALQSQSPTEVQSAAVAMVEMQVSDHHLTLC